LGPLPQRYVYASDYLITPLVAVSREALCWKPDPHEVERVVELPLDVLVDPAAVGRMAIHRGPLVFHTPC
jgi:hypothetical protein